jgi:protein-tyrosine phosphatase
MCRIACEEGTGLAAATAHQNERWPEVTPDRIRQAAALLSRRLNESAIPLTVFPCAEVMVHPEIEKAWLAGEHLSVGDRGQYLLIELPHSLFLDLSSLTKSLRRAGVRPILAHCERSEELLHEAGLVDQLIGAGCLVQVSSSSVTDPPTRRDEKALKSWFKRGVVHFLGSDGHSPSGRPPRMAEAYRKIRGWAGDAVADRVCSTNGLAVLQGLPLRIQMPEPKSAGWLSKIF